MNIITIDTETQGLNTHNFIMGAICFEDYKKEVFYDKEEMWNRILEIGERYKKKKRTLLVYAHNMHYDFLVIKPKQLPHNMQIYSHRPYIVDTKDDNDRNYIKFLDTHALARMPLKEIGKIIGNYKDETPEWLKKDKHNPTKEELSEAEVYLKQDVEVLMNYLLELKKHLKEKGINTRWLITNGQIGISYLMQQLRKDPMAPFLFTDYKKEQLIMTKYPDLIHQALRGGRVESFITGNKKNVTCIDINSHYPYSFTKIRVPHLITERLDKDIELTKYHEKEIKEIGITCCRIRVRENNIGILPIRINEKETQYPNKTGQILIGTWTNEEIQLAIEYGYCIDKVFWTITYDEINNPFKKVMRKLARDKKNAENDIERHTIKMLMNSSIGKLAQKRPKEEYKWAEISEDYEMRNKGYEPVEVAGRYTLYKRFIEMSYPKYYCPILNALVTARSRIILTKDMLKLPKGCVYYCDTDSIIGDDKSIKSETFKYSKDLGDYKLVHSNVNALFYGKKSYMIDDDIKLSGVPKVNLNREDFERGEIEYKRMWTERNTPDMEKVGTFNTLKTDLHNTKEKTEKVRQYLEEQEVIVDHKTTI